MPNSPEVSVVLPCYNAHQFLAQTLDSVRQQTFSDIEIIIVDDGSTDEATVAFLDKLPSDICIVRQDNKGLSAARNTGFNIAKGTYILPLDCDDWLDKTFVEKTLKLLKRTPDATFAYSHLALEEEGAGNLKKSYNFFEQLFFNQMPYCLLLPKQAWLDVGGYNEKMRLGYEDWEFNIRLGAQGMFGVVCAEPLFHYRIRSAGMLKSLSGRSHAELWQSIQKDHKDVYSLKGLFKVWKQWNDKASTYPTFLLVGWYVVFRLLPNSTINFLMRHLLKMFSHSNRVSRSTAQD